MNETLSPRVVDPTPESRPVGHELKDISASGIVLSGAGLALTVMVSFVVVWWLFDYLNAQDRNTKPAVFPLAVREQGRLPPPPRLEGLQRLPGTQAAKDSGATQDAQQRQLETYGWVDRQTGIVRIPIDRAMKIIVEQHQRPAGKGDKQ